MEILCNTNMYGIIKVVKPSIFQNSRFRSYSQNQEDVTLFRALHDIKKGHYLEVGANHPVIKSISFAFYLRGWDGILIEPQGELCELSRSMRPEDIIIESAVADANRMSDPFFIVPGKARSTLENDIASKYSVVTESTTPTVTLNSVLSEISWAKSELHFLILDVEGFEKQALEGLDLKKYRPWVIVVESIDPITGEDVSWKWESNIISARYILSHFDGISRFYIAIEHSERLINLYPSNARDNYISDFPLSADQTHIHDATTPNGSLRHLAVVGNLLDSIHEAESSNANSLVDIIDLIPSSDKQAIEDFALTLLVGLSRSRITEWNNTRDD